MNIKGHTLKNNKQLEVMTKTERENFELEMLGLFEHYWYERLYCPDYQLAETLRYLRLLIKQLRVISYTEGKLKNAKT